MPPVGEVWKRLRKGRPLVLPLCRQGKFLRHFDFKPRVCSDDKYGRLGRVMVLRYHPYVSSSNPVGQVCLRCNWDVQCVDRVPVFPDVVYTKNGVCFPPSFTEIYSVRQDWRSFPVAASSELQAADGGYVYRNDAAVNFPTEEGFLY